METATRKRRSANWLPFALEAPFQTDEARGYLPNLGEHIILCAFDVLDALLQKAL